MKKKGFVWIIIGALGSALMLSVATKTTKVVKTSSAINKLNKAKRITEYDPSPKKLFDRANNAKNLSPIMNEQHQEK